MLVASYSLSCVFWLLFLFNTIDLLETGASHIKVRKFTYLHFAERNRSQFLSNSKITFYLISEIMNDY